MSMDQEFLEQLAKIQADLRFVLKVDEDEFDLFDVIIAKSPTPVRRPTTRGGVYFSDTSAYKIKCSVKEKRIIQLVSSKMLGPNTDFEELQISILKNNSVAGKISGILTNSMQAKDHVELNLVLVGAEIIQDFPLY